MSLVPNLEFRLLEKSDSIEEINLLLKSAYAQSQEAQSRAAASFENKEATQRRIEEGECHLAILDQKIIGCVILRLTRGKSGPEYYQKPDVSSFGRLAVLPSFQHQGVGTGLLAHIENRAKIYRKKELALDTPESAAQLISFYEKRGYRQVGHHQWPRTPFRSLVLSKSL